MAHAGCEAALLLPDSATPLLLCTVLIPLIPSPASPTDAPVFTSLISLPSISACLFPLSSARSFRGESGPKSLVDNGMTWGERVTADTVRLVACFPRTDHLLPTPSIPDLPASSLPWILPQPSVFDHEFRLFPPGYAPALLCGYTAHHWTCLPAR
ncbi:unnamed protein product [Pleuronectes platessa]|uniref:Uncharacterized protein n=1 Tax=Pleuronectes platessa TaxID=8262 RepID=A0A9N7ZDA0_PLEPL|nr:unnamed protein product [Pleuronectes platessa]